MEPSKEETISVTLTKQQAKIVMDFLISAPVLRGSVETLTPFLAEITAIVKIIQDAAGVQTVVLTPVPAPAKKRRRH